MACIRPSLNGQVSDVHPHIVVGCGTRLTHKDLQRLVHRGIHGMKSLGSPVRSREPLHPPTETDRHNRSVPILGVESTGHLLMSRIGHRTHNELSRPRPARSVPDRPTASGVIDSNRSTPLDLNPYGEARGGV